MQVGGWLLHAFLLRITSLLSRPTCRHYQSLATCLFLCRISSCEAAQLTLPRLSATMMLWHSSPSLACGSHKMASPPWPSCCCTRWPPRWAPCCRTGTCVLSQPLMFPRAFSTNTEGDCFLTARLRKRGSDPSTCSPVTLWWPPQQQPGGFMAAFRPPQPA